jgi:hypothetical protein
LQVAGTTLAMNVLNLALRAARAGGVDLKLGVQLRKVKDELQRDYAAAARPHGVATCRVVRAGRPSRRANQARQQMAPTEVGSGVMHWPEILRAAYTAGVREYYIEQEGPFIRPPLESVQISVDYVRSAAQQLKSAS